MKIIAKVLTFLIEVSLRSRARVLLEEICTPDLISLGEEAVVFFFGYRHRFSVRVRTALVITEPVFA
jgi:hypothetical protein